MSEVSFVPLFPNWLSMRGRLLGGEGAVVAPWEARCMGLGSSPGAAGAVAVGQGGTDAGEQPGSASLPV